ncbi:hypothetical protein N7489_005695 [Penicillium chrysogenum]|uniref:uncharacterized protein n=1 Tax=Penicillium chrysogenum TaxID=5076 RepID=UPI0024DF2977|nr:uncharacterized protein N7489_005695 [Penicillium chrysogenum]KAJ5245599.1 hypothetical protein N7489_005695 [Penicillium chrysogenum]
MLYGTYTYVYRTSFTRCSVSRLGRQVTVNWRRRSKTGVVVSRRPARESGKKKWVILGQFRPPATSNLRSSRRYASVDPGGFMLAEPSFAELGLFGADPGLFETNLS